MMENYFTELNSINVSDKTEKKGNLTYLSWAWAWGELKKLHPDATYTIYENADGLFYHTDGKTAWVKTGVTVNGLEHIEYLPIMDFKNQSVPVDKITSVQVNKTIQRSLTKAVARHGLGLYIYAGEDLPEGEESGKGKGKTADDLVPHGESMTPERIEKLKAEMERTGVQEDTLLQLFHAESLDGMSEAQYIAAMNKFAKTADKKA